MSFSHRVLDKPAWRLNASKRGCVSIFALWSYGADRWRARRVWRGNFERALKRLMDIVGAGIGLALLFPFLSLIAVLIKISSRGPVLFIQERQGLNGRSFRILKFRSMHADLADPSGITQTVAGDARVTWIGRFIRATSIDELPQLFNVLKGDMSLVGPRPHIAGILAAGRRYDELIPHYRERLAIKPGLTGLAQCQGLRGPTTQESLAIRRIELDLAYIQNFSIGLDMKILWYTVCRQFFTGKAI